MLVAHRSPAEELADRIPDPVEALRLEMDGRLAAILDAMHIIMQDAGPIPVAQPVVEAVEIDAGAEQAMAELADRVDVLERALDTVAYNATEYTDDSVNFLRVEQAERFNELNDKLEALEDIVEDAAAETNAQLTQYMIGIQTLADAITAVKTHADAVDLRVTHVKQAAHKAVTELATNVSGLHVTVEARTKQVYQWINAAYQEIVASRTGPLSML